MRAVAPLALVTLAGLLPPFAAQAAGIACKRASTPAEQAVCASPSLLAADSRVARLHARNLRLLPDRRAELVSAQQTWARGKEHCGSDEACLAAHHRQRIGELQALLKAVPVAPPDRLDRAALAELRAAVERWRGKDPEFALMQAVRSFAITPQPTEFGNEPAGDGTARFPEKRPNGVSASEWSALRASRVDAGGENGMGSYMLLDLDGDGLRDLVVDSYVGGTGLFNHISTLMRRGGRFVGELADFASDSVEGETDFLYSLNGRGSNQSAEWIRLQGRVYVAYVEGAFGVDTVTLLRPVQGGPREALSLAVRYRYRLSVTGEQLDDDEKPSGKRVDGPLTAVLNDALRALKVDAQGRLADGQPVCPPLPHQSVDEALGAQSLPSHYSFEVVADFAVWVGGQCRAARLVDWFGRYEAGGLMAQLWLVRPGEGEVRWDTFLVEGPRELIGIEAGVKERVYP